MSAGSRYIRSGAAVRCDLGRKKLEERREMTKLKKENRVAQGQQAGYGSHRETEGYWEHWIVEEVWSVAEKV